MKVVHLNIKLISNQKPPSSVVFCLGEGIGIRLFKRRKKRLRIVDSLSR